MPKILYLSYFMMSNLAHFITKLPIFHWFRETKLYLSYRHRQESFSQEGEDLVLARFLGETTQGFYIDVGAHHPTRFSNTYYFYRKGWKGINIDAMPGSMNIFNSMRHRDINLEVPISETPQTLTYHIFNEPALNGFSKEISESRDGLEDFRLLETQDISTDTLANILDRHLPENQRIDFLSIDVEGLDFEVLKSNNWNKYKPAFILVETLNSSIYDLADSDIATYLSAQSYSAVARTYNTTFFKLSNAKE